MESYSVPILAVVLTSICCATHCVSFALYELRVVSSARAFIGGSAVRGSYSEPLSEPLSRVPIHLYLTLYIKTTADFMNEMAMFHALPSVLKRDAASFQDDVPDMLVLPTSGATVSAAR